MLNTRQEEEGDRGQEREQRRWNSCSRPVCRCGAPDNDQTKLRGSIAGNGSLLDSSLLRSSSLGILFAELRRSQRQAQKKEGRRGDLKDGLLK